MSNANADPAMNVDLTPVDRTLQAAEFLRKATRMTYEEAEAACVDADLTGEIHYPSPALEVLETFGKGANLSTEKLISEAHQKRRTAGL